MADLVAHKDMHLAGFVGEVLKGFKKQPFDFKKAPVMSNFLGFDPMGILLPEAKSMLVEEFDTRVQYYLQSGCEYNDVPDIFYMKERIPNWLGMARRSDSYQTQVVSPLNCSKLIDYSFKLSAQQRQMCLIHYQILEELAPDLLGVPFADQTWAPELKEYGASDHIYTEPIKSGELKGGTAPWQYLINSNDEFNHLIYRCFDEIDSPIWSYVNKEKLLGMIKTKDVKTYNMVRVYGLLVRVYVTIFWFRKENLNLVWTDLIYQLLIKQAKI